MSNYQEKIDRFNNQVGEISSWILQQMEASDGSNWEMPWHKGIPLAMNAFTGKFYGGRNMLILWRKCVEKGFTKNRWATLKQWRVAGAQVKRGGKGTLICIAIPKHKRRGKVSNESMQLRLLYEDNISADNLYFKFRFIHVFNQDQVMGYAGDQPDLFNPSSSVDALELLIEKSGGIIRYGGDLAYYSSQYDLIQMPEIFRFYNTADGTTAKEHYHSTLVHELIHWTGHVTRCNRKLGNGFGTPVYAFEELIAELGSALLCTHFGKRIFPMQGHAKYLKSWLQVLKNDFSYFFKALDISRYAIYWLFQHTGVYPYELKEITEPSFNQAQLSKLNELLPTDVA